MNEYLNVLDICDTGTRALGPGLRFAIWVQGCPFNCKGCTTPEGIPVIPASLLNINELAARIYENKAIEGITISGGEPFLQASKLVRLLELVFSKTNKLNVIIYSGFLKHELNWPSAKQLLSFTDILIDGRYVEKLNDDIGLRGSSNQNVNFLTEKLRPYHQDFITAPRKLEILAQQHLIKYIGIPINDLNL